ncbi:PREDICTED: collagen alpha-6(VI) chain-like [Branchiostoma belcheri]|uniref:Collagen alpha-6(VI) chain-like n=1 Tax=Branchiostoma belcheri TaxID=7741 RepID=A0A6P4XQG9_BRABE|nr:PREDICTED: collagen alpha-6(VI) chain-like [Branchiostoma belcheri]
MGTLTGRALTQVHQDFTTANGARAGVQKVIILITDGQASDIVHLPSENIRKQGVLISAVGVANYNLQQLNDIASGGKFVATVEQFDAMDSIRDKVLDAVCQAQQKRGQDIKQEINNGLQYLKRMLGALEDELEQETKK